MAPMISIFMVRLDERINNFGDAITHLLNTHSDPQKVAAWRQQSTRDLIFDFEATMTRFKFHLIRQLQILQPLEDNQAGHGLPEIDEHPLQDLMANQLQQISKCISAVPWDRLPSGRILRAVMEMLIQDGDLSRERIIGAFLILESALASVIEQNEAVESGWWKSDGSWDDSKGNIREIRHILATLQRCGAWVVEE